VANSWTSPAVAETETGTELITAADPWVISYDPEMGTELWRANVISGDVAPSPVVAENVAYVTNEYAKVAAIKTGGVGDVTEDRVLWTAMDGMSDAPSPICDGELFLQVHSRGRMTCYGAGEGKLVWDEIIETQFWASPTLVGRTVYLPSAKGKMYLFDLTDSFELNATLEMGEPVLATPAFADSRIYIRGQNHLFCIGAE
jgi:outer membrane protein assembly factor BamB